MKQLLKRIVDMHDFFLLLFFSFFVSEMGNAKAYLDTAEQGPIGRRGYKEKQAALKESRTDSLYRVGAPDPQCQQERFPP